MSHGGIIPVARLPFLPRTYFALEELCVILSFFPILSPQYKWKEEQCYWFCDVILSTVHAAHGDVPIEEQDGFKRAGKFGMLPVHHSRSRTKFIDIVLAATQGSQVVALSPTRETVDLLLTILSTHSSKVQIGAVIALTNLASRYPAQMSQIVAEAGAAKRLIHMMSSASSRMKVRILLEAIHATMDEPTLRGLERADIEILLHFISHPLSVDDSATRKQRASILTMIAGEFPRGLIGHR